MIVKATIETIRYYTVDGDDVTPEGAVEMVELREKMEAPIGMEKESTTTTFEVVDSIPEDAPVEDPNADGEESESD
jgi:hypothetical protein